MLIRFKNDLDITNYQRLKDFSELFYPTDVKKSDNSDTNANEINYHQSEIKQNIKNLQNENTYIFSIYNILEMMNFNPYQVITFFSKDDFKYLFNGMKKTETITVSLTVLLYIIRNEDLLLCFYSFIKENDFFFISVLKDILNNSDDKNSKKIVVDMLGILSILDEFRPLLIENDIFLDVNSIANTDDEIDYHISYFYYFISDFSFNEDTETFFNQIFPIVQYFCRHQNPEIVCKSLKTIRLLMPHSPLPCKVIISDLMYELFIEYINLSKFPSIQRNSLRVLISCIKYPDFPVESLLQLELIENIFNALQSNDEKIAALSIELFDVIFQVNNPNIIQEIINRCSNYNFLSYFSSQLFETKIKAIDIFQNLIQKLTPESAQYICSEESIEFILNLLLSSDDQFLITIKITNILNILLSLFHNNSDFIFYILSNVKESGSLDYLNQILTDTKITPECNDSIISFLSYASMLKNELGILDEE